MEGPSILHSKLIGFSCTEANVELEPLVVHVLRKTASVKS